MQFFKVIKASKSIEAINKIDYTVSVTGYTTLTKAIKDCKALNQLAKQRYQGTQFEDHELEGIVNTVVRS